MPRRGLSGIAEGNSGLGRGIDFGYGTGNVRPTLTPNGTLSVPDMHGRPSYFPAIDIPMGQRDPSITSDPRYADNIGLGLSPSGTPLAGFDPRGPGPYRFYQYLVDPATAGDSGSGEPWVDTGGPGRNIPPNEDVPPPNNDFYYSGDPRFTTPDAPRAMPVPDWVDSATATDSRGNPLRYPVPGQGDMPAGDWMTNARSSGRSPITMTNRGPMGRGSFGSTFGVMGRGYGGPYGGGNSFGQGVGDTGINPSGNWGGQSWSVGGMSQANLSLGIDPGAMMYRGHLQS